ncbi:hypothetical protein SAMN05216188_115186 [Lentzea xinjiangensis]|uniref:AbiEi antitoxin C-terminal domain-containing protein n=1 Tax=Lentzea xinjiangensis TaxID=402600 RepID=A0A1H9S0W1_9PSEU|nr:type IV toxin-antitoxin system AbiEi family antitoxin [Lentzea xinjiangensis]SER78672.1 hypothetical protein SAMN05216188_115186 [Lentzea xinjiangensis]
MTLIATTADLRESGLSPREVLRRCAPLGPWQQLLPGVVLQKPSPPNRLDRLRAVLFFLGLSSVITGADAVVRQGAAVPLPRHIHVLAGKNARRAHPGILLERTGRMPAVVEKDGLRLAAPARAAVDMARRETNPQAVVQILDAVVDARLCSPGDLHEELRQSSRRGTALVRQALRHLCPT